MLKVHKEISEHALDLVIHQSMSPVDAARQAVANFNDVYAEVLRESDTGVVNSVASPPTSGINVAYTITAIDLPAGARITRLDSLENPSWWVRVRLPVTYYIPADDAAYPTESIDGKGLVWGYTGDSTSGTLLMPGASSYSQANLDANIGVSSSRRTIELLTVSGRSQTINIRIKTFGN